MLCALILLAAVCGQTVVSCGGAKRKAMEQTVDSAAVPTEIDVSTEPAPCKGEGPGHEMSARVASEDMATAEAAVREIEKLLEESSFDFCQCLRQALRVALTRDDLEVLEGAAELARWDQEELMPAVDKLLDHENPRVRDLAIDTIRSSAHEGPFFTMYKLRDDPDPEVAMYASYYLHELDEGFTKGYSEHAEQIRPLIERDLGSDDPNLRRRALSDIQSAGDQDLYPLAVRALGDMDVKVWLHAAEVVGGLGGRRAIPELVELLLDTKVWEATEARRVQGILYRIDPGWGGLPGAPEWVRELEPIRARYFELNGYDKPDNPYFRYLVAICYQPIYPSRTKRKLVKREFGVDATEPPLEDLDPQLVEQGRALFAELKQVLIRAQQQLAELVDPEHQAIGEIYFSGHMMQAVDLFDRCGDPVR